MSKSKLPEKTNSDDVDLGQLFSLIGNAFSRFINFIVSIFKGVYFVVLIILIHIHNRIKWYVTAILIGVCIGFIWDKTEEELYYANLFVSTNYGSTNQVYENIKYLHQLAEVDKDSLELSKGLGLTKTEAGSLRGFYIEPDIDENDRIKSFVNFKKGLDSAAAAEYKYKDYINGLNKTSFNTHKIGVISSDRFIFKKLKGNLGYVLGENDYLKAINKVTLENYGKKDKTLETQDVKIDSLLSVYLSIRERESKKEPLVGTSGTNFFMGNQQQNKLIVDETNLLAKKLEIANQRRDIDISTVQGKNIVNVVSDFPDAGYDFLKWYNKKTFILPAIFFCLIFIGFILVNLGKYLADQEKLMKL